MVQTCLVLLNALFAPKEDKTISHVDAVSLCIAVIFCKLVYALISAVLVATVVRVQPGVCPFGHMADET